MPYTHKKVGNKYVVYKGGKEVGKTAGTKAALDKYLAALHINADKKESVKESITMEQPMEETHMMGHEHPGCEDKVGQICVVLRPSPESSPEELVHTTHAFGMGQFDPSMIHGIYNDEKEANLVAEAVCRELQEYLAEVEKKKAMVTEKIDKVIKDLQKEVNRCMDEGNDQKAQEVLQRIAELRHKHGMVEASKKPLEEKEDSSKKKDDELNEGWLDRQKAKLKGTVAGVSTGLSNIKAAYMGQQTKDTALIKNLAIMQQKAQTLDKELNKVVTDLDKLFTPEKLKNAPAAFRTNLTQYKNVIKQLQNINTAAAKGKLLAPQTPSTSTSTQATTPKPAATTQTSTQQPTTASNKPAAQPAATSQAAATSTKPAATAASSQKPATVSNKPATTTAGQQSTPTSTKATTFKSAGNLGAKDYEIDKTTKKVRVTLNGKRVRLAPINYKGKMYVPLVKDASGKIRQITQKGNDVVFADNQTKVDTKFLKEIQEIINL